MQVLSTWKRSAGDIPTHALSQRAQLGGEVSVICAAAQEASVIDALRRSGRQSSVNLSPGPVGS
jgi:hypothetical protein